MKSLSVGRPSGKRGEERRKRLVDGQRAPVDVPHDARNMPGLVLGELPLVQGALLLGQSSGRLLQLAALGTRSAGLGLGRLLGAVVAIVVAVVSISRRFGARSVVVVFLVVVVGTRAIAVPVSVTRTGGSGWARVAGGTRLSSELGNCRAGVDVFGVDVPDLIVANYEKDERKETINERNTPA